MDEDKVNQKIISLAAIPKVPGQMLFYGQDKMNEDDFIIDQRMVNDFWNKETEMLLKEDGSFKDLYLDYIKKDLELKLKQEKKDSNENQPSGEDTERIKKIKHILENYKSIVGPNIEFIFSSEAYIQLVDIKKNNLKRSDIKKKLCQLPFYLGVSTGLLSACTFGNVHQDKINPAYEIQQERAPGIDNFDYSYYRSRITNEQLYHKFKQFVSNNEPENFFKGLDGFINCFEGWRDAAFELRQILDDNPEWTYNYFKEIIDNGFIKQAGQNMINHPFKFFKNYDDFSQKYDLSSYEQLLEEVNFQIFKDKPEMVLEFSQISFKYLNDEIIQKLADICKTDYPSSFIEYKNRFKDYLKPDKLENYFREAKESLYDLKKGLSKEEQESDIFSQIPKIKKASWAKDLIISLARSGQWDLEDLDIGQLMREKYGKEVMEELMFLKPHRIYQYYDEILSKIDSTDQAWFEELLLESVDYYLYESQGADYKNFKGLMSFFPEKKWKYLGADKLKEILKNAIEKCPFEALYIYSQKDLYRNRGKAFLDLIENDKSLKESLYQILKKRHPITALTQLQGSNDFWLKDKLERQFDLELAKKAPEMMNRAILPSDFDSQGDLHDSQKAMNLFYGLYYYINNSRGEDNEGSLALIPMEDFETIFTNDVFQQKLKEIVSEHKVNLMNVKSFTEVIYKRIKKNNQEINDESIKKNFDIITEIIFDKKIQNFEVMGPKTKILYIRGEDSAFDESEKQLLEIFLSTGGKEENFIPFKGVRNDDNGLNKQLFLEAIEDFKDEEDKDLKLLIYIDMHGRAKSVSLDKTSNDKENSRFSPQDLAGALKKIDLRRVMILAESCFYFDFSENLQNLGLSPFLTFTASNEGSKTSIILSESEVRSTTCISGILKRILEEKEEPSVTIGDLFFYEHSHWEWGNNPGLIICPPNKEECIEVGINTTNPQADSQEFSVA
ncbi:MAG: hypothetical protein GF335_03440 [Candidatus Moranbacteria bacterium]|nr:hypothetical protein [Candidatus Moranbacteria bacterium]